MLLRSGSPQAVGALQEYLDILADSIEVLRISPKDGIEFDDQVISSIAAFLPYRDEYIAIVTAIAKFDATEQKASILKRFFEKLIPYMYRNRDIRQWSEHWFDNFRFIIHEMFLYTVANMIRHEWFTGVDEFLTGGFYAGGAPDMASEPIQSFAIFRQYLNCWSTESAA